MLNGSTDLVSSIMLGLELLSAERREWLADPIARNHDVLARKIVFEAEALLASLQQWVDVDRKEDIQRRLKAIRGH